jgi:hypothetical protein
VQRGSRNDWEGQKDITLTVRYDSNSLQIDFCIIGEPEVLCRLYMRENRIYF